MGRKPTYAELEQRVKELEFRRSEGTEAKGDLSYTTLFDGASDSIFLMEDAKIIECNRMTLQMFGCKKKEDILSLSPPILSPPYQPDGRLSQEKAIEFMDAALEGEVQRFYWKHTRKDGTPFDAEVSLSRLEVGNKKRLLSIVRDITKRKQAEDFLKESEHLYRSLFENNHSVMLLIDPSTGNIVDANPAACSYYGHSRETFIKMKIAEINVLSEKEVFEEMQKAKFEKKNYFEFRHRLSNGTIRDVEVFSGPITVKGQSLLCSIVHDLTDRNQAKAALLREKEKLQDALAEIKKLSGMLPICSSCKKIRDDKGYWNQIESFISRHSEASFSHSLCPDCMEQLYGDQDWYRRKDK